MKFAKVEFSKTFSGTIFAEIEAKIAVPGKDWVGNFPIEGDVWDVVVSVSKDTDLLLLSPVKKVSSIPLRSKGTGWGILFSGVQGDDYHSEGHITDMFLHGLCKNHFCREVDAIYQKIARLLIKEEAESQTLLKRTTNNGGDKYFVTFHRTHASQCSWQSQKMTLSEGREESANCKYEILQPGEFSKAEWDSASSLQKEIKGLLSFETDHLSPAVEPLNRFNPGFAVLRESGGFKESYSSWREGHHDEAEATIICGSQGEPLVPLYSEKRNLRYCDLDFSFKAEVGYYSISGKLLPDGRIFYQFTRVNRIEGNRVYGVVVKGVEEKRLLKLLSKPTEALFQKMEQSLFNSVLCYGIPTD